MRIGYRSFDRQWIIADSRLMDRSRASLWSSRIPGQLFVIEQHAEEISDGPGVVFSGLIPDMHLFNNRGGRALPLLHPGGAPNLPQGLLDVLSTAFSEQVPAVDVAAYIAGVTSHPGFTARYADELVTPGIRVPLTADADLWRQAVSIGRDVIWLQTYGAGMSDPSAGRLADNIRLPTTDAERITNLTAIAGMPTEMTYDADSKTICLGSGSFGPIQPAVWEYTVGGRGVLRSWFNYRKTEPTGKRSSPLDSVNIETWPADWNTELIDLLTVLTRLVRWEPDQKLLLDEIIAGQIMTRAALAGSGVRWPAPNDPARKPNYMAEAAEPLGQLGFPI